MKQCLNVIVLFLVLGVASVRAQAGADLYNQECSSCHGANGEGGIGRPALAGNTDLEDTQHVLEQILQGGDGMPAFANKLSDQEVAEVATFIRTQWSNEFGEVTVEEVQNLTSQEQSAQAQSSEQTESQQTDQEGQTEAASQNQQEQSRPASDQAAANDVAAQQQQVADLRVTVLPEDAEFQISGPPGFETQTFSGGSRMVSGLAPGGYRITANYNGQLLEQVVNVSGGEVSAATLDFTAEADVAVEGQAIRCD